MLLAAGCTEMVPFGGTFEPSVGPVSQGQVVRGPVAEGRPSGAPVPGGRRDEAAKPVSDERLMTRFSAPDASGEAPATRPASSPDEPVIRAAAATPVAAPVPVVEESIGGREAMLPDDSGEMVWPVLGPIVGPFHALGRPDHQGIDLAAPPDTPVVAAESGTVTHASPIQAFGSVVALDHGDGLTTVYAHLGEEMIASVGVPISKGSAIGRIGPDGYLHFEIHRERDAVDPAAFFQTASAPDTEVASSKILEPRRGVPFGASGVPEAAPGEPSDPEVAPDSPGNLDPGLALAGPQRVESRVARDGLGDDLQRAGKAAALIVVNLVFVPVKLAYAVAGAVVGGFAFTLTGGAVTEVWEESLGGDFVLSPAHLSGERPIRFRGEALPSF